MVKPLCFSVMDGNRIPRSWKAPIVTKNRSRTQDGDARSIQESRNGNYRKDNKRLARRSACQSKEVTLHDAHIDLLTGIYNVVNANQAFRQCINPHAKRFEVKYKKYSPAMLEGFTDRCLTLEELLMWRVPR